MGKSDSYSDGEGNNIEWRGMKQMTLATIEHKTSRTRKKCRYSSAECYRCRRTGHFADCCYVKTTVDGEHQCDVSPASYSWAVFSPSSRRVATVLEHLWKPPGKSNTGSMNKSMSIYMMQVQLGWKSKLLISLTIRTFNKTII